MCTAEWMLEPIFIWIEFIFDLFLDNCGLLCNLLSLNCLLGLLLVFNFLLLIFWQLILWELLVELLLLDL